MSDKSNLDVCIECTGHLSEVELGNHRTCLRHRIKFLKQKRFTTLFDSHR